MKKEDEPVIVEQDYQASPEQVWNALTNVDEMRQWYFDNIPAFEPQVGFETGFDIQVEDRVFPHRWKVTEAVANQRIVYDWSYEGYEGDAFVTFEIESSDSNTTSLKLTCSVRESFQDGIPEFNRESCVGGWQYFLQNRLKSYLENSD